MIYFRGWFSREELQGRLLAEGETLGKLYLEGALAPEAEVIGENLEAWERLLSAAAEGHWGKLPLALFEAGLKFRQTRDRRVLLAVPQELREILLPLIQTPGARPELEAKVLPIVKRIHSRLRNGHSSTYPSGVEVI